MSELGSRLRAARTARGLSLRSVAAEAGISPSMLSQVETGKVHPSVSTLYAISGSLGLSMEHILGHEDAGDAAVRVPEHPVQRAEDAPQITMQNGVSWRGLAVAPELGVSAVLVTYDPAAASSMDQTHMRHVGIEHGYIIRGELTLRLDFDTYVLRAGDSLCFDSRRPHYYVNNTDEVAEGIWFIAEAEPSTDDDAPSPIRSVVDVLDRFARVAGSATG